MNEAIDACGLGSLEQMSRTFHVVAGKLGTAPASGYAGGAMHDSADALESLPDALVVTQRRRDRLHSIRAVPFGRWSSRVEHRADPSAVPAERFHHVTAEETPRTRDQNGRPVSSR